MLFKHDYRVQGLYCYVVVVVVVIVVVVVVGIWHDMSCIIGLLHMSMSFLIILLAHQFFPLYY